MTAYLYVLDTLADWEPGYLLAELNTGRIFRDPQRRIEVRTASADGRPVTTMGGVRITPDLALADVSCDDAELLILPGAETWSEPTHQAVLEKAGEFLAAGIPVAAICGATVALAHTGLMDDRAHTSNDLGLLENTVPGYHGSALYRDEAAVADRNLITAGATNPLEFAREALTLLDVATPETMTAWYGLYKTGEARYFYDLMASSGGTAKTGPADE